MMKMPISTLPVLALLVLHTPAFGAEPTSQLAWLTEQTQQLLLGCRVRAHDGTWLYTPDGKGNYRAL